MKPVTKVGLRLNVDKTAILTNEAQLPNTLVTKDGLILKVLERNQGQNWAEYILTARGSMMPPHGFRLPHGKMSMSMSGRRVAGPFWAQAVNQKKTTFTNRF